MKTAKNSNKKLEHEFLLLSHFFASQHIILYFLFLLAQTIIGEDLFSLELGWIVITAKYSRIILHLPE